MFSSYTIRQAFEADLPAIVAIYNSTVPARMATADTEPVKVDSKLNWLKAHNEKRPLWVVEDGKTIIAWLSYSNFYGRPAYKITSELSIYIHEDYRAKGLGKYLLQYAIDKAPALGIKNILGFIFGHNEPSLKLFYHFGFVEWAHLPGVAVLDGIERDLIILGLKL